MLPGRAWRGVAKTQNTSAPEHLKALKLQG